MNSPHKVVKKDDRKAVAHLAPKARDFHVLSVGSMDRGSLVHDALIGVPDFRLSIATDFRRLWSIPKQESIQVVILHNTFPSFELEDASRFIRQQWPHAKILIVRCGEGFLDDELYDDRVAPPVSPKVLLSVIERLTSARDSRRLGNVEL